MTLLMPGSPKRLFSTVLCGGVFGAVILWLYAGSASPSHPFYASSTSVSNEFLSSSSSDGIVNPVAKYFINYPLNGPNYGEQFGELGQRVQIVTKWISAFASSPSSETTSPTIDEVVLSMFPFLQNPSDATDKTPFTSLRRSFVSRSRGIVIPTGINNFRFTCHLILTIRTVLHSKLPIQIAFAGDADLPLEKRDILRKLDKDVEFLNVLSIFDDSTLQLATGGWAIKAFALLASSYEQVILLDADAVFLQPPEVIFDQLGYQETGVLLFHDRLLWQHAFQDRHEWWKAQMLHQKPSDTLLKSLVWMEDYAEEGDSGVVAMDKSRLPVLMGLLHICWQNTHAVREDTTYKITYGDKESWWFGLELSGVPYTFEAHYGSIIGSLQVDENDKKEKVCSFTIAHVDENDALLWFNGSLLKNKAIDQTTFETATHWMMDATWEKGGSKPEMSCMKGGVVRELTPAQITVLEGSILVATEVDKAHALVMDS